MTDDRAADDRAADDRAADEQATERPEPDTRPAANNTAAPPPPAPADSPDTTPLAYRVVRGGLWVLASS